VKTKGDEENKFDWSIIDFEVLERSPCPFGIG
jgi:hypothetical protein